MIKFSCQVDEPDGWLLCLWVTEIGGETWGWGENFTLVYFVAKVLHEHLKGFVQLAIVYIGQKLRRALWS